MVDEYVERLALTAATSSWNCFKLAEKLAAPVDIGRDHDMFNDKLKA